MDNRKIFSRVAEVFQKVMNLDGFEINMDTQKKDVDAWDSMNHLILMAELETEFSIRFGVDEIAKSSCVGVIVDIIAEKMEK